MKNINMKSKINATIVADSLSPQGDRITSYILTYPRIIHAELMTHRMFSRNSASSRAIPFKKMIEMVEKDPFIPIAWQKDHKGMQGSEYEVGKGNILYLEHKWMHGLNGALDAAKRLNMSKVTKQLCNRLLEPFMWHTVLVTATEWDNFFELRCPQYCYLSDDGITPIWFKSRKDFMEYDKKQPEENKVCLEFDEIGWRTINKSQAEIHIQALAESMWDAMNESTPKKLQAGDWHIPFSENMDEEKLNEIMPEIQPASLNWYIDKIKQLKIKISTARCARLSYMTFDGEIDYEKDIQLHDRLLADNHMSPFEHCARAMNDEEYQSFFKGKLEILNDDRDFEDNIEIMEPYHSEKGWCNNIKGFIPYRHIIENELKV